MMPHITPISALIGGILIGASASAMLLLDGKIAGISGIVDGVLRPLRSEFEWKLAFTAGLIVGGVFLRLYYPGAFDFSSMRPAGTLIGAGLLVGFGTRMGSGCTSGHGVCGVSRMSPRSIASTAIFIAAGAATVFVTNHLLK
jgi:hypothetical protein